MESKNQKKRPGVAPRAFGDESVQDPQNSPHLDTFDLWADEIGVRIKRVVEVLHVALVAQRAVGVGAQGIDPLRQRVGTPGLAILLVEGHVEVPASGTRGRRRVGAMAGQAHDPAGRRRALRRARRVGRIVGILEGNLGPVGSGRGAT